MRVWRIARSVYNPLDGEGARLYGGRWNPSGIPVAYTAGPLSLAVLELLVHLDPEDLPEGLTAFVVDVPDALLIETVSASDLPAGWSQEATSRACQEIGRRWALSRSSPVLRVPTAVLPLTVRSTVHSEDPQGKPPSQEPLTDAEPYLMEYNYLINPLHTDAGQIHVVGTAPFQFDPRLPGFRELDI